MNPQTPVIVGVGQVLNRVTDFPAEAKEPLALMLEAVRRAERDTDVELLSAVQSVRVVRGIWGYENPAAYLADVIGASDAQTVGTLIGGNQNQAVINATASEILAGELDLVLICGAENGNSAMKARKRGVTLAYTDTPGTYDRVIGRAQEAEHHEFELAKGIRQAMQIYPMYENAIRHARGETMEAHMQRVAELWSRFSDVAHGNPHAWLRDRVSAEEIRTVSSSNRRVSFPYTKLMNANMSVNMGAALILCSVAKARALGIEEAKWVYPHAGVAGYDHFSASVRDNFHTSPGIRLVAERLLELAETSIEALDFVDLYSCFPSAVQVAASEYGFDEQRDLTVTGGLTFAGGPLNNYVMHAIARTVELLRQKPGALALVTANGGNLYKHVHGVYGSRPPVRDFTADNVQSRIDALPARRCIARHEGEAVIESYTVMYEANDPVVAHVACQNADGARFWLNCDDLEIMQAMSEDEFCGREIWVQNEALRIR